MNETIQILEKVETGEYNGIGSRMLALGSNVLAPDGISKPERDSGMGWVGKYLGATAMQLAGGFTTKPMSYVENGKIVDKRLLAWLLIGRDVNPDLGSENFVFTAETIVSNSLKVIAEIAKMKVLQGANGVATDWRSMFEGFVKASIFGDDFQPTIVTSLGGYDGKVPLAAPFNIIPSLELISTLNKQGYKPSMVITSAAKYGVDCNGLSQDGARKNWETTLDAYQQLVSRFYPESENNISYETLLPSGITSYPAELFEAAKAICAQDKSLKQTSEQYNADPEAFMLYMLSHTQAFRDYQSTPEVPFVIKVGAPSEQRYSLWQKRVIEKALPNLTGFVPNMVLRNSNSNQYGQITLYYPRIGNRPPYYPDTDDGEPTVYESYKSDYITFLRDITNDNPNFKRYSDLAKVLELTRIHPDEYLTLFKGSSYV